jgi:hypothetical protein
MAETESGRRQYPRQKVFTFCRVVWSSKLTSYQVPAMTVDVCRKGLSVLLRNPAQPIWEDATIHIRKDLEIRAAPIHKQPWANRVEGSQIGFAIKQIVSGQRQWETMCNDPYGGSDTQPKDMDMKGKGALLPFPL